MKRHLIVGGRIPGKETRVRLARAIEGHTQSELEEMSGLSYTTIWRFVTGRSNPTLEVYTKLTNLLTNLEGGTSEKL